MGHFAGDYNNPKYVTERGIELALNPIGGLILDAYNIHYEKKYPKPEPPLRVASDEAKTEYLNTKDAAYVAELEEWSSTRLRSMLHWLLEHGIKTNPPDDWQAMFPDLYDGMGVSLKVQWLQEILFGDDLDWDADNSIMNAILGIRNVTEAGMKQAKKG